ncbi:MAG TPA: GNAT family N-acetyltransferase [Galbitalea sp.]
MAFALDRPTRNSLVDAATALQAWQSDDAAFQLHSGDLGWFERFGLESAAASVRSWSSDGEVVAVGLLDEPDLLRLTVAPTLAQDEELALRIAADLAQPEQGVLAAGAAILETPMGIRLRDVLLERGWTLDEAWTPLRRDLADPVYDIELRIEAAGDDLVETRVALQRAAFEKSIFTAAAWQSMAAGAQFEDARDLVGFDDNGVPVAAITVWSADPGRPGLIEPMGVHRDHRGRGYGTAMTKAGAAALRDLGSSSALVCTRSANTGGVATYRKAGFEPLPERLDLSRA